MTHFETQLVDYESHSKSIVEEDEGVGLKREFFKVIAYHRS